MVLSEYVYRRVGHKAGVYIISMIQPKSKHSERYNLVKIGKANDGSKRLNSYHTYFPYSFYTYFYIWTTQTNAERLEKLIHAEIMKFRLPYRHKDYQGVKYDKYGGEWFELSMSELEGVLQKVAQAHFDMVKQFIIVNWYRYRFIDNLKNILGNKVNEPTQEDIDAVMTDWKITKPKPKKQVYKGYKKRKPTKAGPRKMAKPKGIHVWKPKKAG